MDISEETFIINLGTHIRKLREKRGLSQQDLADDCGIPRNQIGRIERAKINTGIKTLIRIANALDIELADLLSFQVK
ncbi:MULTISPECIES: helix-turn-helix domain-containing protein [Flavobacterium]|jgi:transcriptional regulator with XRE-family HTH domain|uniref:Transcriptional regulator, XRE family n=1 Tax=Flavobacterium johnsoniae (strain ATCC 17061 / DSM 2064 / JCM 8514 / BCRC 14874 / CCUG 350202 / NBRC 14942 / NCIMB 11054 / UW101) TaxID=376686 RepID=A5FB73_FLAJ1|nr:MULTISPECIES: helix-turn-helix transcriptional regulator [Flavobacterium]ABQ07551.1 transcriptional regulator, XRE family [Flavobacterium johnsoniae UW101]OXE99450.1 transcriptional regulator [Flavobacterium johnsoniae UW101]WDF58290.1 helix-turn-helix transcriptional regulator [Flavobacterium sp. KACC 22758]WQG80611.1 helix-turn-helix transcriptional regulator [Flavobacterium johnsoniae UW101]SHL09483.1 DNA-binding transcriptional regulator, XRE-family HTH domain [Flavobacterium johnsoniae